MTFTRRQLLKRIAALGSYSSVFCVMQALGLLPSAAASTLPSLPKLQGKRHRVLILGAGIAGLSATYELEKAGYECVVLEALQRAGGRNWTLRSGDNVAESSSAQRCTFDNDLYFNTGPARIPSQHKMLLGYCKAFNVALEVFVNSNRNALFHDERSAITGPIESRQAHTQVAGYIAELLAKAVRQAALDEDLTALDRSRLLGLLRQFGALDSNFRFRANSRNGYEELPGAAMNSGKIRAVMPAKTLLSSSFMRAILFAEREFDMQATMLQPVGGMDRIVEAFVKRIKSPIRYVAKVSEIRNLENQVEVIANIAGVEERLTADYCVCTIPLPVLKNIKNNFADGFQSAIAQALYTPACKLAWQADERFWEDQQGIYGGISWVNREISQVWYPSSNYHSDKGILLGAYNVAADAVSFAANTPQMRAAIARKSFLSLHRHANGLISNPISVAWQKMPFSRGAFSYWPEPQRATIYRTLNDAEGRVYLCGEHLSHWGGWQEGSILSAHHVLEQIHSRTMGAAS